MTAENSIWVFNTTGEHKFFPLVIFSSLEKAENWIMEKKPKGVLSKYILDKPDDIDFPEHYHYEEENDYFRHKK